MPMIAYVAVVDGWPWPIPVDAVDVHAAKISVIQALADRGWAFSFEDVRIEPRPFLASRDGYS